MAAGCGLIALGAASGISTSAILAQNGLFIRMGDASGAWFYILMRTAAFNMMLVLAAQAAVYHGAALPFACAALSLKGTVTGFAMRQLFWEFSRAIALPGVLSVFLTSFPMLTALLISFACCAANRKADKDDFDTYRKRAYCCTALSLFLTVTGSILEGWLSPVLLRLFYRNMV